MTDLPVPATPHGRSARPARLYRPRRLSLLAGALLSAACSDGATIFRGFSGEGEGEAPTPDVVAPAEPGMVGGVVVPDVPEGPAEPAAVGSVDSPAPPVAGAGGAAPVGSGVPEPMSGPPPVLRSAVISADDALAPDALALMGSAVVGAEGSCANCHSLGRPTLTRWLSLTNDFASACLSDPALADAAAVDAMLACFDAHAAPASAFAPRTFGIYSAAAHLPWFSYIFQNATAYAADWRAAHEDFVGRVGMPRAGALLSQQQFDVVAEWFARGLPRLFDLVPEESGEACAPGLAPSLGAHVDQMATSGWKARNEQVPLLMFGCGSGQATSECLSSIPLATAAPHGQDWDAPGGARIRILFDNSAAPSNYWSRSSADGRYIASGLRDAAVGDFSGQFLDLQRGKLIDADFSFDPTFFPDNSGFVLQRGGYSESTGPTDGSANRGDVAVLCNQSVLGGNPLQVLGNEAGCTQLEGQIGLYQQVAKSIDGEDYWVVYGSYGEDNSGFTAVLENPSAAFDSRSTVTLLPMINTGAAFEAGEGTRIVTPLQGDPMLSPSGRILVTRLQGREYTAQVDGAEVVKAEQSGYALHLVTTTKQDGELVPTLEDAGRICLQGGKAVLSYDERWMVIHHYVTDSDAVELGFSGPDDPAFAEYRAQGASNLYLVDLLDGSSSIITRMAPGQYALFPHFRSDGWIYFVVRTLAGEEYFAATDAAVLAAGPN